MPENDCDLAVDRGNDSSNTAICTWFVGDDAGHSTFLPQLGVLSNAVEAQATYWRCTLCFFASSILVNPDRKHIFFTNVSLPIVDKVNVATVMREWGVEVVYLPITYRLPKGSVASWGNQFYIFDIIAHIARNGNTQRYLVLDSDCLWIRPVDAIEVAIDQHGVLTYELGFDEHPEHEAINGVSRAALTRFAGTLQSNAVADVSYCGGEFFAATRAEIVGLSERLRHVWPKVVALMPDAPREEAHLLSVLYTLNSYESGTANPFVRRMWTTFKHNNLRRSDTSLTIWHLPAEKRTGFRELFEPIARQYPNVSHPRDLGFGPSIYRKTMGFPRRRPIKLIHDLTLKLREKAGI